ncbi:MAG: hypothetical protein HC800_09095 [Phormidesmis sp. RL_2_1]|nr:hypothetical protein [Phormidesmis sp. RL_2_1]
MKRKFLVGFGFAALVAMAPVAMTTPVFANLQEAGEAIVEKLRQPEVKLVMSADKQVTVVDENGDSKLVWEKLENAATVQPGDILRYVVASENEGEISAENLVITQPISPEMTFKLGSVKGNDIASVTYSIDGGETFVAQPMVEVTLADGTVEMQPAPAEAYTQVRWDFSKALDVKEVVSVSHEVVIK